MGSHDDFAFEPVPGLPAVLPKGERLIWQGSPNWRVLARLAFRTRWVATYFAALLLWRLVAGLSDGVGFAATLASAAWLLPVAISAIAILYGLAFAYGRTTIYSLTTKRLIIRSGVALPVTINLPLSQIENASVAKLASGHGNIVFELARPNKVAFLLLWPHAKPFAFRNPQPMLRGIADVEKIAAIIAASLRGDHATPMRLRLATSQPAPVEAEPRIKAAPVVTLAARGS
jgi:hypothetical protein